MRTSHFTRFIALAALSLGLAGTALAQDATPSSTAAPTDLSRAQVLADLEMWHRAGLTYVSDREIDVRSTEYQRGLERYQQLRASPAATGITAAKAVANIDFHNTEHLASDARHARIVAWFLRRH